MQNNRSIVRLAQLAAAQAGYAIPKARAKPTSAGTDNKLDEVQTLIK